MNDDSDPELRQELAAFGRGHVVEPCLDVTAPGGNVIELGGDSLGLGGGGCQGVEVVGEPGFVGLEGGVPGGPGVLGNLAVHVEVEEATAFGLDGVPGGLEGGGIGGAVGHWLAREVAGEDGGTQLVGIAQESHHGVPDGVIEAGFLEERQGAAAGAPVDAGAAAAAVDEQRAVLLSDRAQALAAGAAAGEPLEQRGMGARLADEDGAVALELGGGLSERLGRDDRGNGNLDAVEGCRLIEQKITKVLADEMLFGQLREGGRAEIDVGDGELTFRYVPPKVPTPV